MHRNWLNRAADEEPKEEKRNTFLISFHLLLLFFFWIESAHSLFGGGGAAGSGAMAGGAGGGYGSAALNAALNPMAPYHGLLSPFAAVAAANPSQSSNPQQQQQHNSLGLNQASECYLSIYLSIYLSTYLFLLFIYPTIHLFIYLWLFNDSIEGCLTTCSAILGACWRDSWGISSNRSFKNPHSIFSLSKDPSRIHWILWDSWDSRDSNAVIQRNHHHIQSNDVANHFKNECNVAVMTLIY